MEAAMKTLAARMVLATSLALATLAAAESAYAQDYQSYEAAYVHRRHATPPYAYDTQANPKLRVRATRPRRSERRDFG